MAILIHLFLVLLLLTALVIFAYLDRVYRELGRVTTGRIHGHLGVFEAEIEPRLRLERRRANATFSLLARFWLIVVAVETSRAVWLDVPHRPEAIVELVFFLGVEVAVAMQLLPYVLLARTQGRWLAPLIPLIRLCAWMVWPIVATLDLFISLLHLSEETEAGALPPQQEAIEALVEAATEEGILEQEEARMIGQVVEFSDKRVRDVMTPRPDIVAVPASATLEQLRRLLVETKYSRLPVYDKSLDDVLGIIVARDLLQVPERDAARRAVRELVRPALFVPETKLGSDLLKEMQRKNQQMAIVIDEYGLIAGLVTAEDLVEEIVGEIGEEDRVPAPDVVRESGASLLLRGSVAVEKVQELFGVELEEISRHAGATTIAGLLNSLVGHVPRPGEMVDYNGLRFEVLEANQRKVLRLRARRRPEQKAAASDSAGA